MFMFIRRSADWVLALLLLLAAATVALAEPLFSFTATPGKLPKSVVPSHYAIDLKPDLEQLALAGSEIVDIQVLEPTDRLVLNAVNMTIGSAVLDGEDGQAATVAFDEPAQTVTLSFPRTITTGRHRLAVSFGAHINKFGRGLFLVDYPVADGRKKMISSHLEPADARRIFPGWDEPAFKASFELTVTVPQAFRAVSNMPVALEQPIGGGLKRVSFARTPRMSSYLFVLAAGELDRITGTVDGIEIGVVATAGKSGNGRYALDSALALMKYFNDYFGVKYALPKLDLIAVPGGFGGAMENWGGITFFESRILFDEAASPPDLRRSIFSILAHEMAHQWFGDLVTMAWWDNIWLNEGFASWMQAKSAAALHPEWQTWLNSDGFKQAAMGEDARKTSHPIQQNVANESEASALFDTITYGKGQAVLRMVESWLGDDSFRAGIRAYMRLHAFSSTTTADLWSALADASGKPVAEVAGGFTEQAGVPLIVVQERCEDGSQRITLRRERFSVRDPGAKPQAWQVPIAFGVLDASAPPNTVLLRDDDTEVMAGACGEPVKLNPGGVGYYRVQYDAATRVRLAAAIRQMMPADRVNVLGDAWALAEAGRSSAVDYLELVDRLGNDDSRAVWEQVIRTLSRLDHLEMERPGRAAFQAYARAVLRPALDRLGWDAVPGETIDRALMRPRLLRALGDLGDEDVLAEARRRFVAFLQDPASLSAALRDAVVHLAGRNADRATYDSLLALGRKSTSTEERVRYFSAAASARDPALARDTLALALTDDLPNSLTSTLITWVASQGEHPDLAWTFVKANFSALSNKLGPSFRRVYASNLFGNFTDPARAAELQNFAPVNESSGGRIIVARTVERILAAAEFSERELPAVDDWVKSRLAKR